MTNKSKALFFTVFFCSIVFLGSICFAEILINLNPTVDQFLTALGIGVIFLFMKLIFDLKLSQLEYNETLEKMVDKFPK